VGVRCSSNWEEAARLLKLAADAGHALAANLLSELYEKGRGVAKSFPDAVRYYRLSSDISCPIGMFNLADMHLHGKHIAQNVREAVRLYQLGAQAGLKNALFALCELYRDGEADIPPDLEQTVEAAKLSADRGHFRGLVQYAELIWAYDPKQADALFAKAHAPGFQKRQVRFPFVLSTGKGSR
jgi:TPR repeat protein